MAGLWWMIVPLLAGYLLPWQGQQAKRRVDRLVTPTIYLLLALMGLGLAGLDDLGRNLTRMAGHALVLLGLLSVLNGIGLWGLARCYRARAVNRPAADVAPPPPVSIASSLIDGALLIGLVGLGCLLGRLLPSLATHGSQWAEVALYVLLALIGAQLKQAGLPLRELILNRRGVLIAVTVLVTSQLAGIVAALVLGLPVTQGLALASGFGWYSLSGILMTDQLGSLWGGVALLNDLGRELIALLLVPLIARRTPELAVGYCGATAMDVTLPMLSRSGGITCVPLALVSGFLLSLLAPPMMVLWLAAG
ncbi:lysine exporter LysO family protein [Larsenimonas rhizosphaerae]|uniref:lysine exporter LysO family protein n=1 Tax=Larsenimonas rhizosphaerae TaxID=2944682 RepID=UPI0020348146|nr:lysine exporter LysO family protein [Larsenimonas rhizosphaerae]MCM2129976.1 lysine exporter LysO family protein [Larsenimonas rhizosphaerae]